MTSAHRKAIGKFAACMKNKKQRLLPPFSGGGEAEKADTTCRIFFVVERKMKEAEEQWNGSKYL